LLYVSTEEQVKAELRELVDSVMTRVAGNRWKEHNELVYWKRRKAAEQTLANAHYKPFYTRHFGLTEQFYAGKSILDIGCGPRGSLEWADTAERRVGLDPLAREYLKLGADRHAMQYVDGPSEAMPFPDRSFDVVCSFNSLDHVSDVADTISEIKRVTRSGGAFLLLVEVNHPATPCEPHMLRPHIVDKFAPEFACVSCDVYKAAPGGLYESLELDERFPSASSTVEMGWLSAKFVRN
jgi:ubiquinone/menaquinone biosynthesis C-methylase UbiE